MRNEIVYVRAFLLAIRSAAGSVQRDGAGRRRPLAWGRVMTNSGIVHHRAIFAENGRRNWLKGNGLQAPPGEGR